MNVNSSAIKSVDTDNNDLLVTFKTGRTYRYAGAAGEYSGLVTASSVGQHFNASIKGQYAASDA